MSETSSRWPSYRFRAMGSRIVVWLDASEEAARSLLPQAETIFQDAEAIFSRFDAASELSFLNDRTGRWVAVSPQMRTVVRAALEMAGRTGGLFDPTLLAALEAAGYDRSFEGITDVAGRPGARSRPGRWRDVRLDPVRRRLYLPEGIRLDLGGIVKGITAQQVVNHLGQWGPCLVDAGGDLVAGEAPAHWPGWPVAVAAPSAVNKASPAGQVAPDLFQLWLASATLATSGVDYRRWQHEGQPAHHIVDPRTGLPAQTDALTATVLAPDAAHAEGWATAALVAGLRRGSDLLQRKGLAGVVVGEESQMRMTPAMAVRVLTSTGNNVGANR